MKKLFLLSVCLMFIMPTFANNDPYGFHSQANKDFWARAAAPKSVESSREAGVRREAVIEEEDEKTDEVRSNGNTAKLERKITV